MKISLKNINKPAPRWFRKLKRVVSLLSDTTVVMLLSLGYSDDSLIILIFRVGISAVMNSLEILLWDDKNEPTE